MKKSQSIAANLYPVGFCLVLLVLWQTLGGEGASSFLLPSPLKIGRAFALGFGDLMGHALATLEEAFWGLALALFAGFLTAVLMDAFPVARRTLYPLLVVSQTVPTVALAPVLVILLGYGTAPKAAVVALTCFFPLTIALFDGLAAADPDMTGLLRAMGANRRQIFRHVKWPGALPSFFSGLTVAVTYSLTGAVIAEWLGGDRGLGVYMMRVKKSYAYDKMFAAILLVTLLSLFFVAICKTIRRNALKYNAN